MTGSSRTLFTTFLWTTTTLATISGLLEEEIAKFVPKDVAEPWIGAKPYVNVTESEDGRSLVVEYNAIPHHYLGQWDGQTAAYPLIKAQKLNITIKKFPEKAFDTLWCLPLGVIAVTTGGVPIYNPYAPEAGCRFAKDAQHLDVCGGRTDENGVYHYYGYTTCAGMFKCDTPGEIYGVAIDGYPIYGPYDERGNLLTSKDLDECGGRLDDYGRYRYHITVDQPNILYCLKGAFHKDLVKSLDENNFICNCPYTDVHFKEPKPLCEEPETVEEPEEADTDTKTDTETDTDTDTDTDSSTDTDTTKDQEDESSKNSTKNETEPVETIDPTCNTPKQMKMLYSTTQWGGRNTTRPAICNFTTAHNLVDCDINQTLWEARPSWVYEEKDMLMLPCCPSNKACGGSCWRSRTGGAQTNLNPECVQEEREINVKERVMIPNSSIDLSCSWIIIIETFLHTILGTLLSH